MMVQVTVIPSGADADGITLDTTGGGALKIKDGGVDTTQLATDAVETLKIADGEITVAKLDDNHKWEKIVTLNLSGSTAVNTGTFSAYDLLKVVCRCKAVVTDADLRMTINEDGGGNYEFIYLNEVPNFLKTTGASFIALGHSSASEQEGMFNVLYINGKRLGSTHEDVISGGLINGIATDTYNLLGFNYLGALNDVTRLDFTSSQANGMTGEITVWGLNLPAP